jgi:hypothetical protein
MRRLVAVVLIAALIIGVTVPAAYAGTGTNVALGLASFAVFNQLVGGFLHPHPVHARPVVVYSSPPVYYSAPATVVTVPPPPSPTVVQYPHGRYELRGDGVTQPYLWVWIPNPPPPPPRPAPSQ